MGIHVGRDDYTREDKIYFRLNFKSKKKSVKKSSMYSKIEAKIPKNKNHVESVMKPDNKISEHEAMVCKDRQMNTSNQPDQAFDSPKRDFNYTWQNKLSFFHSLGLYENVEH